MDARSVAGTLIWKWIGVCAYLSVRVGVWDVY